MRYIAYAVSSLSIESARVHCVLTSTLQLAKGLETMEKSVVVPLCEADLGCRVLQDRCLIAG